MNIIMLFKIFIKIVIPAILLAGIILYTKKCFSLPKCFKHVLHDLKLFKLYVLCDNI